MAGAACPRLGHAMTHSRKAVVLGIVAAVVALGAVLTTPMLASANSPATQSTTAGRFTSWAQSQQILAPTALNDQPIRMITHLSQGGDGVRLRVQNQFGTTALPVDAAAVALTQGQGPAEMPGTGRAVTFNGGHQSVTVPTGGQVWSDPAKLATRPQDNVAVSLFVPDAEQPGQHNSALRNNYLTAPGAGNQVGDESGAAFTQTVTSTCLVSAVDVHNPGLIGTIVPFGSSVVDGTGSTNCGPGCTVTGNNQRWADDLARRIGAELPADRQLAVANEGIGGTTSAVGCPDEPTAVKGLEAGPRLARDVLALHGVTGVIFYYGTNDLLGRARPVTEQAVTSPVLPGRRREDR
jgi:GDSL-like Lipase/Acylhydrolase